jgi:DNA-binding GntR family transcriptional regulator
MEKLCKPAFVERFLALDNAIHSKIWSVLPNRILEQILQSLHGKLLRYNYARYVAYQDPEIMEITLDEHKKIAYALSNKNRGELKKLAKAHWSFFIQRVHLRNIFLNACKGGEYQQKVKTQVLG